MKEFTDHSRSERFKCTNYGYALFSITGMETSVFYIAITGIIIVPSSEVSIMSQKVLDGMGKSYHTLILTIAMVLSEIGIVTLLAPYSLQEYVYCLEY